MHVRSLLVLSFLVAAAGTAGAQAPAGGTQSTEELYKSTCMPCHMADGNAALEPMNFVDGKWKHGSSVKELAAVIADGVPGTAMMPFKTRFSEQEIVALAKYVRQFDKSLASGAKKTTPKKK